MSGPFYRDLAPLERQVIFTPLGIRFRDSAREVAVGQGLELAAWPEARPDQRRRGSLTRSGVYMFQGLPGLAAVERAASGDAPASPPLNRRFVVEVRDQEERFVPVVFRVYLPYRGIFPTATLASPGGGPPGFYLFSAPTRPAAGLAVLRVELVEPSGAPAAHGVVEVEGPGATWYGVANGAGVAAVMFAYPPFGATPPTSPPRAAAEARQPQRWPVTVRVRYQPAARAVPAGSALPDLSSIFAQAHAPVRPTAAGPPALTLAEELEFGSELVLASAPRAQLLVG